MEFLELVMPVFPHISVSFFINTTVLLIILILFFIFYTIITSVLMYHWATYGMRSAGILVGETLFILISLILFGVSILSLYYF